jgi:hypothetical protein
MRSKRLIFLSRLMALWLAAFLCLAVEVAAAPSAGVPKVIMPTSRLVVSPPRVRTWAQMQAATAAEMLNPTPPAREIKPFLPTMGQAAYAAAKARAAPSLGQPAPASLLSPILQAPATLTEAANFLGVNQSQAGGAYPPDTEGAAGPQHFVEITNAHVDIYLKAAPNTRVNGNGSGVTLKAFFGDRPETLFDPRVIFDPVGQRWILSADTFAESPTEQYFFFAVSQTADPTGAYYIYDVNVGDEVVTAGEVEWDFPQVGLDQNALIFTANFFHGNTYVDSRLFTVPKSQVYNGQLPTPPYLFKDLKYTLSPPLVLDNNPNTYVVSADTALSPTVALYTLTKTGAIPPDPPTLTGPVYIPVAAYTVPPNAPQPGTTSLIDTSDCRFVNVSTQIGNSLFQVHTINIGGCARPKFYEFDPVHLSVIQSGTFSRSSTSYDFNASIAANRRKDVMVTWSATDPTNSINAEVHYSGRLHTDPAGVIPGPGGVLYTSTSNLTGNGGSTQRWGDYSAVSLDPADSSASTTWIVNETILAPNTWASQIGSFKMPSPFTPAPLDLLLLQ